ncbi:substrate-binding domain-containing protein [Paractinoplanes rishiriensis]|uniref:substrate-binding domain-containing protein n=1 Tax=Paractinoplanes rishiriensis TaxID=1050105 RepID=UPI00194497BA|nr:substrate-binding domain-containing protein [Actinoplanes rishiriensis]
MLSSSQLSAGKELGAGFTYTAGLLGAEAVVSGPPQADPPKQVEIFKQMMNSAKGGVAIQASDTELIARDLAAAVQGGFPVIAVDIRPAATSGVKTFVGNDNHQLGERLADELIGRLPAGSTGMVVVGSTRPGLPVMEQRLQGIRDRFAAKLPGVKVAGPFDTQTDPAANQAAWKRLAAATPGALALIGTGSTDGPSIAAVHTETKAKWLGAGFDLNPKTVTALQDGELVAIASPEHYLSGAMAGWLQVRHAQDGIALPQGWVQTPSLVITTKNLPEIIKRQQSDNEKAAWFKPRIDELTADLAKHTKPLSPAG